MHSSRYDWESGWFAHFLRLPHFTGATAVTAALSDAATVRCGNRSTSNKKQQDTQDLQMVFARAVQGGIVIAFVHDS